MEIYYCPEILIGKNELNEEESYHCVKVLRHIEGDEINLIDGAGSFYTAKITTAHKSHCGFEVIKKWKEEIFSSAKIHLAIAPTKNMDRMEWLCEKAVEIGVNEISLIECEHSERRKINVERLHRICVSAMKQSQRASLPKLNEIITLKDFIGRKTEDGRKNFICHLGENKTQLTSVYQKGNDATILIGPEGDFTKDELKAATDSGFKEVILGSNRLRTETAALVAITIINSLNA